MRCPGIFAPYLGTDGSDSLRTQRCLQPPQSVCLYLITKCIGVLPGQPSASSSPPCAGAPVMHRGYASEIVSAGLRFPIVSHGARELASVMQARQPLVGPLSFRCGHAARPALRDNAT
jgi:hypothetical protein